MQPLHSSSSVLASYRAIKDFSQYASQRMGKKKQRSLTGNLHDVTRDNLSGLNPLHTLSVRSVDFAHLRLVLLQSLDGALSITLLSHLTLHFSPGDTMTWSNLILAI